VDTRFNGQVTGGRFALAFAIEGNRVARLVSATTLVGGVEPLMRRIERLARGLQSGHGAPAPQAQPLGKLSDQG
jgi:hypothetical protein